MGETLRDNTYIATRFLHLIVVLGPYTLREAHNYLVTTAGRGEKVAIAQNDYECPFFELLAKLDWVQRAHWVGSSIGSAQI